MAGIASAIVAPPVFNPASGSLPVPFTVTVTCPTSGADIHYTLNGSEPTLSDPVVASGSTVGISGNLTLKAKAWVSADVSATTQASYFVTGEIAAGGAHTLALKTNKKSFAWGEQQFGRLGNGVATTADVTAPSSVLQSLGNDFPYTIVQVAAGDKHSVILDDAGNPWAFGYNGNGQLGDNSVLNRLYPVQVTTASGALTGCWQVAAGELYSLALTNTGAV